MKRLIFMAGCLAAASACGADTVLGGMPRCAYADTEAATNVPFAFGPQGARNFRFELSLAGTPSNNVQLAFGRDANSDGVLAADETGMTFAWDCGGWRIVNGETGETLLSAAATTNCAKALEWDLLLRRGRSQRLAVFENGVPVFAELADVPERWFHSSGWDMLRLTVRGVDAPQEDVRVGMEISGYTIRMR